MTQIAKVLDAGGSQYTVASTPVLDVGGTTFTVSNNCLDAAGASWIVFYDSTVIPPQEPTTISTIRGRMETELTVSGRLQTELTIRGRIS
jgi:hypothetical protein